MAIRGSLGLASLRLIPCRWLCGPNHLTRRSSCSVYERFNSRTVFRNVCFHPRYASGLSVNVEILVRRSSFQRMRLVQSCVADGEGAIGCGEVS